MHIYQPPPTPPPQKKILSKNTLFCCKMDSHIRVAEISLLLLAHFKKPQTPGVVHISTEFYGGDDTTTRYCDGTAALLTGLALVADHVCSG